MECFELKQHCLYIGTQFHPEFKSKPFVPSPPFFGFVRASISYLNGSKSTTKPDGNTNGKAFTVEGNDGNISNDSCDNDSGDGCLRLASSDISSVSATDNSSLEGILTD